MTSSRRTAPARLTVLVLLGVSAAPAAGLAAPSTTVSAGGITLRNILRGVAQTGTLGYWIGEPHARRGYTLEAVDALARFAFGRLGLHRLEAACCPDNDASRRLLLKAGFELEGRARGYLKIDGRWRDHLLFGKVREAE